MGRLPKKKTGAAKKKKKGQGQEAAAPAEAASSESGAVQQAESAGKEEPKKPVRVVRKPAPAVKKEKNFLDKSLQFLREVKIELKKVTWPSRKQTIGSTVVVLILVMIISFFLGVVDMGLSSLVRVVLQ
jgi:preprotein translocase subunit SecE